VRGNLADVYQHPQVTVEGGLDAVSTNWTMTWTWLVAPGNIGERLVEKTGVRLTVKGHPGDLWGNRPRPEESSTGRQHKRDASQMEEDGPWLLERS
jgi:hypothetical protein